MIAVYNGSNIFSIIYEVCQEEIQPPSMKKNGKKELEDIRVCDDFLLLSVAILSSRRQARPFRKIL